MTGPLTVARADGATRRKGGVKFVRITAKRKIAMTEKDAFYMYEINRLEGERDYWQAKHTEVVNAAFVLSQERDKLCAGITAIRYLIEESRGVVGLHLNGDEAPWNELRTGGHFEHWLVAFDTAVELTRKE